MRPGLDNAVNAFLTLRNECTSFRGRLHIAQVSTGRMVLWCWSAHSETRRSANSNKAQRGCAVSTTSQPWVGGWVGGAASFKGCALSCPLRIPRAASRRHSVGGAWGLLCAPGWSAAVRNKTHRSAAIVCQIWGGRPDSSAVVSIGGIYSRCYLEIASTIPNLQAHALGRRRHK